jgi:hypothetical protein
VENKMKFNVASACCLPGAVTETYERFRPAFEAAGQDVALICDQGWVDLAVIEEVCGGLPGRIAIRDLFWERLEAAAGRSYTKQRVNHLMPRVLALAKWPVMSTPAVPRDIIEVCAQEAAEGARRPGGGRKASFTIP